MRVSLQDYNLIFEFQVLWSGWECDGIGYVGEKNGVNFLLLSNHVGFYIATIDEMNEKISEYNIAITNAKKAIDLTNLNEHTKK